MSDSVFYLHGIPVAVLSDDGRYRKVELSPEDRSKIETKLNEDLKNSTPVNQFFPQSIVDEMNSDAECRMKQRVERELLNNLRIPSPPSGVVSIPTI